MSYLTSPCPRPGCGAKTLLPPPVIDPALRMYAYCETCGRKALYILHVSVSGKNTYTLKIVGAPSNNLIRATFWIKQAHKRKLQKRGNQSEIVRDALDRELGL